MEPISPTEQFLARMIAQYARPDHVAESHLLTVKGDYLKLIADALQAYPAAVHGRLLRAAWDRIFASHRGKFWPAGPAVRDAIAYAAERAEIAPPVPALPPVRDDGIDVLTADEYGKFLDVCELIDRSAATGSPPMANIGPLKAMADILRAKPHRIDPRAPEIRAERDRQRRKGNHGWSVGDAA